MRHPVGTGNSQLATGLDRRYHQGMARRRADFDDVLRKARSWSPGDQAALVEELLTPKLRLRLMVEQVRNQVRAADEHKVDNAVNRSARRVRRAKTASR